MLGNTQRVSRRCSSCNCRAITSHRPAERWKGASIREHDVEWPTTHAHTSLKFVQHLTTSLIPHQVTGTPAERWKGASIWEQLLAPFGQSSGAWRAVNEVLFLSFF